MGDRFSFQDAIANMMLPSSNATANVGARTFGQILVDSEDSGASPVRRFVQEMNATAARLGMTRSSFVNPYGLRASSQVTTAADMARLLAAASERASSVKMIEDDNICGGKTRTLRAITYNLAICSRTAAGTKLASVILCSASDSARYADMRLLLSALDKMR